MGGKGRTTINYENDPNIGKAAMLQATTGEEYLNLAKEQFAYQNVRQNEQDEISNKIANQQYQASVTSQGWAEQDRARYIDKFIPLQDDFISQAQNWDSQTRQDRLAAEAKADVLNEAAAQRQASNRNMAAMGINPDSGRFAGIDRGIEHTTALASAGAQNAARNTVRNQAVAMQGDALNLGNGLGINPATSLGLGVTAGSSAFQTTSQNNAQSASNFSTLQSGYRTAMDGYANQANILNQQNATKNQVNVQNAQLQAQNNASLFSGIGGVVGMGAMMFSSKDFKEDKKPVEGALEALGAMPVESWKYKDGIGDGDYHIGPYAEDFQKATGVGSDKMIKFQDALGLTMKAVQELSGKVDSLKKEGVGLPKRKPQQRRAA